MMSRMLLGVPPPTGPLPLAFDADGSVRKRDRGPAEGLAIQSDGDAAEGKSRAAGRAADLAGDASAASSARATDELLDEILDEPATDDGREDAGEARSAWTSAREAGALASVAGGEGDAELVARAGDGTYAKDFVARCVSRLRLAGGAGSAKAKALLTLLLVGLRGSRAGAGGASTSCHVDGSKKRAASWMLGLIKLFVGLAERSGGEGFSLPADELKVGPSDRGRGNGTRLLLGSDAAAALLLTEGRSAAPVVA